MLYFTFRHILLFRKNVLGDFEILKKPIKILMGFFFVL